MISIKITISSKSKLPAYQSKGSAGADLFAALEEELIIEPGQVKLVPTGLFLEIPDGYEAQIRPRSGLAFKNGISVLNSPGTIDSDYRGEVKIIMANFGEEPFKISHGMRIAQMVFAKVYRAHFIPAKDLEETERGSGGFGHTGT